MFPPLLVNKLKKTKEEKIKTYQELMEERTNISRQNKILSERIKKYLMLSREKEAKEKLIKAKETLEQKIKESELLYDAKFKQVKSLGEEAREKVKKGDKEGAKRCLMKKKKMEKLVETLNNQLMMMDEQVSNLENAIHFGQITSALKHANNIIKENTVTVEELQSAGDQLNEIKNHNIEINQIFEDYNNENEDDIEDELDKCEKELMNELGLPSANKEEINSKEGNKNIRKEIE